MEQTTKQRRWEAVIALAAIGVVWIVVTLDTGGLKHRGMSPCRRNLKLIGRALHSYHEENGSLSPAYATDAHGRRMHSWRVLILPYLQAEWEGIRREDAAHRKARLIAETYSAYRFTEPWDGPNNRRLQNALAEVFHCPNDKTSSKSASYLAIVGQNTAWPGAESASFDSITDGLSNTLLVVEVRNSGIGWSEPRDLNADEMSFTINDAVHLSISSPFPDGAAVLLCDGSTVFLWVKTTLETVRALTTRNGGERLPDGAF